ncbi:MULTISPECIES: 16S rRNA (guanine(966)-N(2))-methyltransferase RsmD [unclassified Terrabacter]|jgi:16S rRNA (guanine966-N2)-methyltransferase|uniref:16S rRNA (guanine(966)-N(2))-methyltransferase RsmD n=1 Tax=unclassified Terrabacter TaxID=2630222 RepID=UPI0006FB45AE|nr:MULTISPECIES: 16S rRNA (guanine(966)-N(2))-methyltransferase RsmD [unclassified Terrabacter]KRB48217.1 16S rRNA (guanine(966)-N(2))-methyltransferase RsmD [Terrabacter sp. Root181]KRF40719.1 16S rRNA (guanine(966)-N(2))-methyltransferase RsmD [Terrabacter sp. Soil810]
MTRIISGTAGGRRLQTPPGSSTRPTSDRVREALFSRLEHRGLIEGASVLDLYAGSGALGLEAASRGAAQVLLVESHKAAAKVIRANAVVIGHPGVRVLADTVERALAAGPPTGLRFDLVLVDPPYDVTEDALAAVLAALVQHQWLAREAFVVVERSSRSPQPTWPDGLELSGEKRYGETAMWFAEPPPSEVVA